MDCKFSLQGFAKRENCDIIRKIFAHSGRGSKHDGQNLEGSQVKIRLLLPLALIICILFTSVAVAAGNDVLYNGIITRRYPNSYTNIYDSMDFDEEGKPSGKVVKTMSAGNKIQITAVYPGWAEIKLGGKSVGYVLRHRIDVTENPDPIHTPNYPIVSVPYYAVIDRDVEVKADKSADAETLSLLTDGARVAIVGMEDGWAVVIHKRVYGYINTNDLAELLPVASSVETADSKTPISVFNSFYNNNPDRIVNLGVCCKYISIVMQPGETMNFNNMVSPFNAANGYKLAPVLVDGETKMGYGGGSCQVSSTLWDTLMQLPGITVLRRNPHGDNAASYLPHGMDAASGTDTQNFIFRNDYDFPIRIDASTHDLALFVAIYKEEM